MKHMVSALTTKPKLLCNPLSFSKYQLPETKTLLKTISTSDDEMTGRGRLHLVWSFSCVGLWALKGIDATMNIKTKPVPKAK
jgi:hypothetical protein